jgi:hypothetical protein
MFSILRGFLYENINEEIMPHDVDQEVDLWSYDGKDVYRGTFDPNYLNQSLRVYWLYDDDSNRIGLAEHEDSDQNIFKVLWFHENPFQTLLQEDGWTKTSETLWSKMSPEAYQDCLETDFKTFKDQPFIGDTLLVTPEFLAKPVGSFFECRDCGKKSISKQKECQVMTPFSNQFSFIFLDDDFVIHIPPSNSKALLQLKHASFEQREQVQESPLLQESLPVPQPEENSE